jgi:hypothetical protein
LLPEIPLFDAGLERVKRVQTLLASKKDCKGRGFDLIFKILNVFFQTLATLFLTD